MKEHFFKRVLGQEMHVKVECRVIVDFFIYEFLKH